MPFSGYQDLDPTFAAALQALIKAYPGISINSGYRTPERQAELYNQAIAKYGSEAEARRHVAPPGHSLHNARLAADLAYADEAAKQAAHAHAAEFKLNFPMSYEDWHIEPVGARGALRHVGGAGSAPSNFNVTPEESAPDLDALLAAATTPAPPPQSMLPDQGMSLSGLDKLANTSGDMGGGNGGLDFGGGDTASGDLETPVAGFSPEVLGQRWEQGAKRTYRSPQDLADLFSVKKIGLAEQLARKA
jgi:hypothetical protein